MVPLDATRCDAERTVQGRASVTQGAIRSSARDDGGAVVAPPSEEVLLVGYETVTVSSMVPRWPGTEQ
jgi:hypothetical protein